MEYVSSGTYIIPGARWRWEHSLYYYHLIPDRWSLPSVQRALHPFQGWGIASVQWAPHPSWEMKFTQCAANPSSLLRMRFSQCAVNPSSLAYPTTGVQWAPHPWHCLRLTDEVYTVCNGPLIPNFPWKMRLTQCATSPSSILRMRFSQCAVAPHPWMNLKDEVYLVCNQPLIPKRWSLGLLVCSGPFISLEGGGLPSVQWAPHPS